MKRVDGGFVFAGGEQETKSGFEEFVRRFEIKKLCPFFVKGVVLDVNVSPGAPIQLIVSDWPIFLSATAKVSKGHQNTLVMINEGRLVYDGSVDEIAEDGEPLDAAFRRLTTGKADG